MQSKSFSNFQNTRQKAKKIIQTIWDGPGKFFIVIFISMFIVGIHESLKSVGQNQRTTFKPTFSVSSSMKFPNNFKENKNDMAEVIKKNQNKAQNEQDEEDLNVLLEMANYQMEYERRKSLSLDNPSEDFAILDNENDDEILRGIIREDKIYINI